MSTITTSVTATENDIIEGLTASMDAESDMSDNEAPAPAKLQAKARKTKSTLPPTTPEKPVVAKEPSQEAAHAKGKRKAAKPKRLTPKPAEPPQRLRKDGTPYKKRRYKAITIAKREIRHQQGSLKVKIPFARFLRLVREIMQQYARPGTELRIQEKAIRGLHEEAENFLTDYFRKSYMITKRCKRITLMQNDMKLYGELLKDVIAAAQQ